jgi:hypothetical protein
VEDAKGGLINLVDDSEWRPRLSAGAFFSSGDDGVARLLELAREEARLNRDEARVGHAAMVEAQRAHTAALTKLVTETATQNEQSRDKSAKDKFGFALGEASTRLELFTARNCNRDDVGLAAEATGPNAYKQLQLQSATSRFADVGILAKVTERAAVLVLAMRLGNPDNPCLQVTETPARSKYEVHLNSALSVSTLGQVLKGKEPKTAAQAGVTPPELIVMMKAQATVLVAILGKRHRDPLASAIALFERRYSENTVRYSTENLERGWMRICSEPGC